MSDDRLGVLLKISGGSMLSSAVTNFSKKRQVRRATSLSAKACAGVTEAKIEPAGFHQVRNLQKSCDNFWHGSAVKDGSESDIVLTPQGR